MHEQEAKAKEFVDRLIEMRENAPDYRGRNDVYAYLYITFGLIFSVLLIYLELILRKKK